MDPSWLDSIRLMVAALLVLFLSKLSTGLPPEYEYEYEYRSAEHDYEIPCKQFPA